MSGHGGPSNLSPIDMGPDKPTPPELLRWAHDFAIWLANNINADLMALRYETKEAYVSRRIKKELDNAVHHNEEEFKKNKKLLEDWVKYYEAMSVAPPPQPLNPAACKIQIGVFTQRIKDLPPPIGKIREIGQMAEAVEWYMKNPGRPFAKWDPRP